MWVRVGVVVSSRTSDHHRRHNDLTWIGCAEFLACTCPRGQPYRHPSSSCTPSHARPPTHGGGFPTPRTRRRAAGVRSAEGQFIAVRCLPAGRLSNNNNRVSGRGQGWSVGSAVREPCSRAREQGWGCSEGGPTRRELRLRLRTCGGRWSGQVSINSSFQRQTDVNRRDAEMAMKKLLQRATAHQDALPAGE